MEQFTMVIYGEDIEIGKMQWRELDVRLEKMNINDIAYIAGLFDGEGCVTFSNKPVLRKGKKRAYPYWNIRLEVNMTHEDMGLNNILGSLTSPTLDDYIKSQGEGYSNYYGDPNICEPTCGYGWQGTLTALRSATI